MFQKLDEVEATFEDIETRLTSPGITANPALFQKLSKEHSGMVDLVKTYREFRKMKSDYDANIQLIKDESDLTEMAIEENKELEPQLAKLETRLKVLLLPKDPNDDKNIMVEIRAGAGGDEAGLFAAELFKMYAKFAENNRWQIEVMSLSDNAVGGIKELVMAIRGDKVYSRMKYESGVHRVQRVPKTETQGRVHTSTVTVAVLVEAEDVEINIQDNELRIDVFRSSGPGGQSVNTTDSAVRVTHIPTGIVVICRDEKSQHKNKAKALKVLKTRLLDKKQQEQDDKISADRLSQVGSGDRSEKVRTYNFPQGRVTDHRIGFTVHQLDSFMGGAIEPLLSALSAYYEAEALKTQSG